MDTALPALPAIPAKRYFTIGEVSDLCGVKAYVLRYWEQEFTQLRPMKRRGNRRYYQHHEVLLIRRIRELLYDQGFTISGARNRLAESMASRRASVARLEPDTLQDSVADVPLQPETRSADSSSRASSQPQAVLTNTDGGMEWLAQELGAIRRLLED